LWLLSNATFLGAGRGNGEKRSIPVSKTLRETLQAVKVRCISGRVFPMAVRSLRAAFENALTKANIENLPLP
jgi:hypothetical protein